MVIPKKHNKPGKFKWNRYKGQPCLFPLMILIIFGDI